MTEEIDWEKKYKELVTVIERHIPDDYFGYEELVPVTPAHRVVICARASETWHSAFFHVLPQIAKFVKQEGDFKPLNDIEFENKARENGWKPVRLDESSPSIQPSSPSIQLAWMKWAYDLGKGINTSPIDKPLVDFKEVPGNNIGEEADHECG